MCRRLDYESPASRPRTWISGASGAGRRDIGHHSVWRDDLWPRVDELDAVNRLARDWSHLLFQLRETPQPSHRTTAGAARGHQADPIKPRKKSFRFRAGNRTYDPAEDRLPWNPRDGLLGPNAVNLPVRLASFSLSA
jgi:hypothetical protein